VTALRFEKLAQACRRRLQVYDAAGHEGILVATEQRAARSQLITDIGRACLDARHAAHCSTTEVVEGGVVLELWGLGKVLSLPPMGLEQDPVELFQIDGFSCGRGRLRAVLKDTGFWLAAGTLGGADDEVERFEGKRAVAPGRSGRVRRG